MIQVSNRQFTLRTAHTAYVMGVDDSGFLRHICYGRRTPDGATFAPDAAVPHPDAGYWPNLLPFEYGNYGSGDHRLPAVEARFADGSTTIDLRYAGAEVLPGLPPRDGLPGFRGGDGAQTLAVTLADVGGLRVTLYYTVYEDLDLITRAACIENAGEAPLALEKAASLSIDMGSRPLDFITLNGAWAHENGVERAPVRSGIQSVGSWMGIPGHFHNPAAALCAPDATENSGECWGFAMVYSGNFEIAAHRSRQNTRLVMGIHPRGFRWRLAPGERFCTPEVAMIYADSGLGGMSRRFHRAIRERLLPPRWQNMSAPRPVLVNSWEACYFDFDEARLLNLARAAKRADVDLLVVDDGWFGHRDLDDSSLGDWTEDKRKLPDGMPGLCEKVNAIGLDLGIWIEPEAVSPDSDLYRAHPDWALAVPGRTPHQLRNQFVLDFSRPEVVDGVWAQIRSVLESCPIRYVKWDMNRALTDVYSAALPAERQGEVLHRYVLGMYSLQRRLTEAFPDLLLENCAGGGSRFDCGMLYFSPQIWTSDDTDAAERVRIQMGASLFYPACCMGAHYSVVPNHYTRRTTSTEARMACALSGTFGFELDLTALDDDALEALRPWVAWYRAHGAVVRGGDLYRLQQDAHGGAWMYAAPDGSEAAVFAVGSGCAGDAGATPRLRLAGLKPGARYQDEAGRHWFGAELMSVGLPVPGCAGDVPGMAVYLSEEAVAP